LYCSMPRERKRKRMRAGKTVYFAVNGSIRNLSFHRKQQETSFIYLLKWFDSKLEVLRERFHRTPLEKPDPYLT